MNKYLTLTIVLVALVASGVIYRQFLMPDSMKPVDTGVVKEFTVIIEKDSWSFEPEVIDVVVGDTVKLKFVNEDDYDHGVGVDAYGVSQRIPARATLDVPPFLASKVGDYQFYCSVSCSEGIAQSGIHKGQKRGHFDQIGTICVHKELGDRVCVNGAPTPETLKASEVAAAASATTSTEALRSGTVSAPIPQ